MSTTTLHFGEYLRQRREAIAVAARGAAAPGQVPPAVAEADHRGAAGADVGRGRAASGKGSAGRIRRAKQAHLSVRALAKRVGVEPSYLSKIERGLQPPPSEATIARLAAALGEDADVLLAMAGKVSTDLQEVIRKRPAIFAELIRQLKKMPDRAVLRIVRQLRDRR
ncbi:MAG: helix-turn-helix domain-containing protein [Planctomycetaceae bacterium]|nr:helix-turn-helix domain-containing protein [Planctomycetaceae bacterium]